MDKISIAQNLKEENEMKKALALLLTLCMVFAVRDAKRMGGLYRETYRYTS